MRPVRRGGALAGIIVFAVSPRAAEATLTPTSPAAEPPASAAHDREHWWDLDSALVGSRPRWSLILLAWLIPASIAVLQAVAGYALRGVLEQEWMWAFMQFPRWMSWALVTPIIFHAAERFPFRRGATGRAIAVHLVIAILVGSAVELVWMWPSLWLAGVLEPEQMARMRPSAAEIFSGAILSRLLSGIFTYAAVLGIANAFGYYRRFREREVRAAQLEAQLALAQVQALKMQVHPHFLFNTLHAVTVLIREDPAAATRVVTRLGDLLRLTLSRATTAQVSFRRELEILTLYLDIERTRFHDRLVVRYDVQPATLSALVPDLILQPLVENAIKHGVSPNAGTGCIDVHSRRDGEWLVLEIRDNGAGLAPGERPRDGVGLTTTKARLERLYGARHELTLENHPEGGFVARIRVPFQLSADDRHEVPADAVSISATGVTSVSAGA
ncbi:MAG TPA: histidine kinase [Gemmatimonadaceae bacterium]|jgi:signal transduction histidine kinase|nr:histidine kinase [Gemmatimonadaceae bacterium]